MPSKESTQQKLDRIRPPRVKITYDVETLGAIEKKELPFVVGILADLSGKPDTPPAKVKDRKFVQIDRDNFDDILAKIGPRLAFQVNNKLARDDSKLNVELRFNRMADFRPEGLVQQIESLRKLHDARRHLSDLIAKLDGNDDLDKLLLEVANNTEELQKLQKEAREAAGTKPPGREVALDDPLSALTDSPEKGSPGGDVQPVAPKPADDKKGGK